MPAPKMSFRPLPSELSRLISILRVSLTDFTDVFNTHTHEEYSLSHTHPYSSSTHDHAATYSPIGHSHSVEAWRTIGAAGQPAFGTGWSSDAGAAGGPYEIPRFKKTSDGTVHLIGRVTKGGVAMPIGGAADFIVTLPVGYRPSARHSFIQQGTNLSHGAVRVDVFTSGVVAIGYNNSGSTAVHLALSFSADA